MNRMLQILIAVLVALTAAACGSDSQLPVATGKGSVRMINAIPTSPQISFLIEERRLGSFAYKSGSLPANWDDLQYTFNFEISRPQQIEQDRIASRSVDVARDVEYTFVVRGGLEAPIVDVWEIPERVFGAGETFFEMRIGHAADALGPVDVYLGLASGAPDLGDLVATLAPGEVSAPEDREQDSYVVTITPAGNPAEIIYQSVPNVVLAGQSALITIFEGDANDTAPVTIRVFNQQGGTLPLADARFPPTARFVHATTQLGTVDLYDDEAISNRIVADLAFGDVTGDIDVAVGEVPITATAPGNVGAILLEDTLVSLAGARVNYYLTVSSDEVDGFPTFVDRRPIETVAQLTFFHSASNHGFVDLYVVESGNSITEALPRQAGLGYGLQTQALGFTAGSYDVYITPTREKTVLDGPVSLEAALGDVFEAVLLDRVDPALAEFKLLPAP
jgi:hypothetical protein